jgi:Fe-Mn family superoxide dismutase
MKFELPQVPYGYDALEPYIDAKTMEVHHSKHHQAYVNNLNAALEKHPELPAMTVEKLLQSLDELPEDIRTAVKNHGGGHWNHSFFWTVMQSPSSGGGGEPQGAVADAIKISFGDFATFKDAFSKAAAGVFGSGWAWVINDDGYLSIITTPNQESPVSKNQKPVLVVDAWEHAYYLNYQNRRPDYIAAWWNVVDWNAVEKNLKKR